MLRVSQTIYKQDGIVNSKINENAPKVTLALLNLTNAYIQLFLLLETGSKPISGFVLATYYPLSLHQKHTPPRPPPPYTKALLSAELIITIPLFIGLTN